MTDDDLCLICSREECICEELKKARAEALEEAAKSIRYGDDFPHTESVHWNNPKTAYGSGVADGIHWCEEKIRALKDQP